MSAAVTRERPAEPSGGNGPWYAQDAEAVTRELGVDPARGLTAAEAAVVRARQTGRIERVALAPG